MNPKAVLLLSPLLLAFAACTAPRDPDAVDAPATGADATPPAVPAPAGPVPPAEPPAATACDADAADGFVGQVASAETIEQARVAAGAAVARTLAPGQVVTMEFRGDRLNLMVDEANVVTGVRCG
jgi:hypothetical protein